MQYGTLHVYKTHEAHAKNPLFVVLSLLLSFVFRFCLLVPSVGPPSALCWRPFVALPLCSWVVMRTLNHGVRCATWPPIQGSPWRHPESSCLAHLRPSLPTFAHLVSFLHFCSFYHSAHPFPHISSSSTSTDDLPVPLHKCLSRRSGKLLAHVGS